MWLIKSTKHSYTHTWGAAQTPNVYALKNIGPSYTHAHTMLGQAYTHEHTKKVKHKHARTQENMHTHSRDGRRRRRISLGRRQVAFIFCMPACCVCAWEYWSPWMSTRGWGCSWEHEFWQRGVWHGLSESCDPNCWPLPAQQHIVGSEHLSGFPFPIVWPQLWPQRTGWVISLALDVHWL